MTKIIFIICDGLADRPIEALDKKTPLEAAHTPNLDQLSQNGICGLIYPVDVGVRPGSDIAHLSLFGYDIKKHYIGRGPFEAAGYGLKMKNGDVAFRGNFATVNKRFKVQDRRAGRIGKTEKLVSSLNGLKINNVRILVKVGVGHRVAVVFRGSDISSSISSTDPREINADVCKSVPKNTDRKARKTSQIVNKFTKLSYEILSQHPLNKKREEENLLPANIVLLRSPGRIKLLPSFKEKYGLTSYCIAGGGLYLGIGKLLGMKVFKSTSATGTPDSNLKGKIKRAVAASSSFEFVFVHIKGADSLAEDGDFIGKKTFIEKVDAALKPLLSKKDALIAFTSDHTTSSYLRKHTADPVPVVISYKHIFQDRIARFNEKECANGLLGRITGDKLMPTILDYMGLLKLKGG